MLSTDFGKDLRIQAEEDAENPVALRELLTRRKHGDSPRPTSLILRLFIPHFASTGSPAAQDLRGTDWKKDENPRK